MKWNEEKVLNNIELIYSEIKSETDIEELKKLKIEYLTFLEVVEIINKNKSNEYRGIYTPTETFLELLNNFAYNFHKDSYDNILNNKQEISNIMLSLYNLRISSPKLFFKSKINEKDYLDMIEEFFINFDEEHYKLFLKLFKGQILLTNKKYEKERAQGLCFNNSVTNETFITTIFKNMNNSTVLPHEIGHAYQIESFDDYQRKLQYHVSSYRETYPKLLELLFIEYFKDSKYKDALFNVKNSLLNQIIITSEYYLQDINKIENYSIEKGLFVGENLILKKIVDGILSETLAVYFYHLYKNDKNEFNKSITLFNNNIGLIKDSELYNLFSINDIVKANKEEIFFYKK